LLRCARNDGGLRYRYSAYGLIGKAFGDVVGTSGQELEIISIS
jgi:hypothetical protein